MDNHKTDLRITRTRKMIIEAFVELVKEKGYDSITIQDIADRAMINRSTFYAHFKDKQDLYESLLSIVASELKGLLDPKLMSDEHEIELSKIHDILTNIFIFIKKEKKFLLLLTESSDTEVVKKKFLQLIKDEYQAIFAELRIVENDMEIPLDLVISYISAIFFSIIEWWIKNDTAYPPEQVVHLMIKLIGNANLTILGIKIKR